MKIKNKPHVTVNSRTHSQIRLSDCIVKLFVEKLKYYPLDTCSSFFRNSISTGSPLIKELTVNYPDSPIRPLFHNYGIEFLR